MKVIIIDRIDKVEEPVRLDKSTERYVYYEYITDVKKACDYDLALVRTAVEQYNNGIRESAALSVVGDRIRNLRACGYHIRIVDEEICQQKKPPAQVK